MENQLGGKSKVVFPKLKPMRKESYLDIRKNQISQPNLQSKPTFHGNSKVLKTKKWVYINIALEIEYVGLFLFRLSYNYNNFIIWNHYGC